MAKPTYKRHEFITKKEKERQERICNTQFLCRTYEVMIKDHIRTPPAFYVGLYVSAEIYRLFTNYT